MSELTVNWVGKKPHASGALRGLEKWATEYLKEDRRLRAVAERERANEHEGGCLEKWKVKAAEQAERKQSKRDRALASKLLRIEQLIGKAADLLDDAWEAADDLRHEVGGEDIYGRFSSGD